MLCPRQMARPKDSANARVLVLSFNMFVCLCVLGKGVVVQVRVPYLHVLHNLLCFHAGIGLFLCLRPCRLRGGEGDESSEGAFVVLHGDDVVHLVVEDGTGDGVGVALDSIEVGG